MPTDGLRDRRTCSENAMSFLRKWCTPTTLFICLLVIAVQSVRATCMAYRARLAEQALRDVEQDKIKNLELIVGRQRWELNRLRLQIKELGSPSLPLVSPEDVDRAVQEEDVKPLRSRNADPA
jgi:hypothetical protein